MKKKRHHTRDDLKKALKSHNGKKGVSFDDIVEKKSGKKATSSNGTSQNNDNKK